MIFLIVGVHFGLNKINQQEQSTTLKYRNIAKNVASEKYKSECMKRSLRNNCADFYALAGGRTEIDGWGAWYVNIYDSEQKHTIYAVVTVSNANNKMSAIDFETK